MKKWYFVLLFILVLAIPVSASPARIVDNVGLLSSSEEAALEEKAAEIVKEYGIDVVIVTVLTTNGVDAQAYADDYFDQNGYGIGENYSGVLLLLVMDTREWVISTCGDAMDYISSSDADTIFENVSSYISAGEYYIGFDLYFSELTDYLLTPLEHAVGSILIALLIGLAAGGIGLLILRSGMKTAKQQRDAGNYVIPGSYKLLQHHDFYLYSTTTRVRKESNNSSGSHRSSSGRSHGGSRGRF